MQTLCQTLVPLVDSSQIGDRANERRKNTNECITHPKIFISKEDYNFKRPHRSLKMKTPNEFASGYKMMLTS